MWKVTTSKIWKSILVFMLYSNISVDANEKKVICYLNSNKVEPNNYLKFNLEKVDIDLCTHLIYSFAVIKDGKVIPWNKTLDVNLGGYANFNELKLKNPKIKTILSIRESPDEFSQISTLLRNGKARFNFVENILKYIKEYGFDGIDIIWWHPGLENGYRGDRRNYIILLKEIRKVFIGDAIRSKRDPYLISIGIPYNIEDAKEGYDIVRLNRFVDWFNIMSYDSRDLFLFEMNNTESDDIVNYYVKNGANREKIVLGASTYGLVFEMKVSNNTNYSETELLNDPQKIFKLAKDVYVLSSSQICDYIKDNPKWNVFKKQFGSVLRIFAFNGNDIIIFKDISVIKKETKNVLNLNLAGMSFWALDQDDFNGLCLEKTYPLINIARQLLTQGFIVESRISEGPLNFKPVKKDEEQNVTESNHLEKDRIVCYTTNWSVYRTGSAKFDQFLIDPDLCTHLIYAYANIDNEEILLGDENSDIILGGYANFKKLKLVNKNLKLLIGLQVVDSKFSKTVGDAQKRDKLINNILHHLKEYEFDGVDIVWKYPEAADKNNFITLLNDLRIKLVEDIILTGRSEPYLISISIPGKIEHVKNGYDLPKINDIIDWYNLLSFDYHLSNEGKIYHHSPLFAVDGSSNNLNASVNFYMNEGIERTKLVIGIPTYGVSFTLNDPKSTDFGSLAKGPGNPGKYTNKAGTISYFEICSALQSIQYWKTYTPYPGKVGPYVVNENQWIGYDDEMIVKAKAEYVAEMGLGGVMFWTVDQDDFRGICGLQPNILIETAKSSLLSKIKQYEVDLYFRSFNFDDEDI